MNWDGLICDGFREIVRAELTLRNKVMISRSKKEIPVLGKDNDKIISVLMFKVLEKRREAAQGLCTSFLSNSSVVPKSRDLMTKVS